MSNTLTQPKSVVPAAFLKELKKLDQGALAELPPNLTFNIKGMALNAAAIGAMLQVWIASFEAVDAVKAQYRNAVAQRLAVTPAAKAFTKVFKTMVKAYYGPQSDKLAAFGINVDKPVETTAQQKLVTAAKRAQTRAVRGTMGKKQKAKLTVVGNPAVLVPSTGDTGIAPPPVNVGHIGTKDTTAFNTASNTRSSAPATAPASTPTPAPAGSGSGSGTPGTGGNTPPVAS